MWDRVCPGTGLGRGREKQRVECASGIGVGCSESPSEAAERAAAPNGGLGSRLNRLLVDQSSVQQQGGQREGAAWRMLWSWV